MKRLIVGNWKMNLGPSEAELLVKRLEAKLPERPKVEIVICPPFIDLFPLARSLDPKKLKLGAQNLHWADEGAYTGEVSGAMLKGLVKYVIVGHSERRAMGETDKEIARKMEAALRNDLIPVLCVGENLHEREAGHSERVVVAQVTANLNLLTAADVSKIVVAYEPVWAIGSGTPATPEQITPPVRAIRATVEELYGEESSAVRIIYGASVAPEFVKAILKIPGVEGLLPGGASLNYETFAKMVELMS